MSQARAQAVLEAAISQGLLPATAQLPEQDTRPWPVVMLTALGAWLAAVPLTVLVSLLFGHFLGRSGGYYLVGSLLWVAGTVVLRSRRLPLWVEQLALPALLVGGAALGLGLFRDLPKPAAAVLMAALALWLAVLVSRAWLRVLSGAAAAALAMLACMPDPLADVPNQRVWLSSQLALAAWLAALWTQQTLLSSGARARWASGLESVATGWLVTTLAGLALSAGMSFLVGASLGSGLAGDAARRLTDRSLAAASLPQLGSLALTLTATAWMARQWPSLRQPRHAAGGLVLAMLAWFMPTWGAAMLAVAVCATSARWRMAGAAGLTAAWVIGAFYYQLQWPLAHKALLLLGAGALLAGLAWLASRGSASRAASPTPHTSPGSGRPATVSLLASGVLVLVATNTGIWQKEDLIARGRPVFVALAPVDPRSLMQGDFMRLNFSLPSLPPTTGLHRARRPHVVLRRDARGVASAQRLDDGAPLAADELRVELTPRDGRWVLVSDAWFFAEGEAARWAAARYGEFRVGGDGRALLVGLRGADLQPL